MTRTGHSGVDVSTAKNAVNLFPSLEPEGNFLLMKDSKRTHLINLAAPYGFIHTTTFEGSTGIRHFGYLAGDWINHLSANQTLPKARREESRTFFHQEKPSESSFALFL